MNVFRISLILVSGGLLVLAGAKHADWPPPAHTGGFNEPTCQYCHFDSDLNAPGGRLQISGLPDAYVPGKNYTLSVNLSREDMKRGGFQMAARFAKGEAAGRQAGNFRFTDDLIAVDVDEGVEYIRHTPEGTSAISADSIVWTFTWQAPGTPTGPVAFHVAANAANGDESAFGDYIYTWKEEISNE